MCLPEGSERLEVDGLQHMLWCIKLQQKHDEDSVVWKLLELSLPHIVILDQHTHHNAQNLNHDKKCSIKSRPTKQYVLQKKCVNIEPQTAVSIPTLLRRLILVTVLVASPECLTRRAMSRTKASRLW